MKLSKKLIILLTFVLLLVTVSMAAASQAPSREVVSLRNASVHWEVPSLIGGLNEANYECSHIPAGLEIVPVDYASDRLKIAKVRDLSRNNGRQIVLDDTVIGIATDQYGQEYDFYYKNVATFTYDGDGVVHVHMEDTYWMGGGDIDYTVSFIWEWMIEAPDGLELVKIYDGNTLVNLAASPGQFPTDDGFTESPSIIPGSWNQILTDGFIFGCDPI